MCDTARTRVRR